MTPGTKTALRYTKPSMIITFVLFALILAPTAYMANSDYYTALWNYLAVDQYRAAAWRALAVGSTFCFVFLFGLFGHRLARRVVPKPRHTYQHFDYQSRANIPILHQGRQLTLSRHRFVYWAAVLSALSIWAVFLTGGYEKIAQYGQNIDRLEYRLIGANDRNRAVTAIIQVARRLILPFCLVYFVVLRWYSKAYSIWFILFLLLSLIVGVIMTLERGPLMLIVVMFFYIEYIRSRSLLKLTLISSILCLAIILLGGTMTFIQYNIQGFDIFDIMVTGLDFISNRAVMAPNFVPIELSYGLFDFPSEKLLLRFSRLMALITGNYVGTLQESSIYVGPVGAIGDIWRNLGLIGIVGIGFLLGLYFAHLDRAICNLDPAAQSAASFTVISLVFYFFYGTFFSQGVFLQIFFLLSVMKFFYCDGISTTLDHGVPRFPEGQNKFL